MPSSAPTRRRSISCRRRPTTCWASTAGSTASSTSTTSTASTATIRAASRRASTGRTSSARSRTSTTTCCATRRSRDHIKARGGGKLLLVMFDEETEELVEELGLEIALPPAKLRKHIDSKIVTTQLGNEAGIASVPNTLGRAKSFAELHEARRRARSWATTSWCRRPTAIPAAPPSSSSREDDWNKNADVHGQGRAQGDARINHLPGTVEGVRHPPRHAGRADHDRHHRLRRGDALQGRLVRQRRLHRRPARRTRRPVQRMAQKLGDRLYKEGYKGAFCMDFLIDTDTREVYLGEINPRISGASPADQPDHLDLWRLPALPVPSARVHGRRLGARPRGGAGSAGPTSTTGAS